jgi:Smg protein
MRYIESMYEVLVYVYENYWGGDSCPGRDQLGRRLSSAGFERDEIQQALSWLDGLNCAAEGIAVPTPPTLSPPPALPHALAQPPSRGSLRVYNPQEIEQLGPEGIACIHFLEGAGALSPELRELVIDRALAMPEPIEPDDLRIIIMMVYWRLGANPDVLVLDELCDDTARRLAH